MREYSIAPVIIPLEALKALEVLERRELPCSERAIFDLGPLRYSPGRVYRVKSKTGPLDVENYHCLKNFKRAVEAPNTNFKNFKIFIGFS